MVSQTFTVSTTHELVKAIERATVRATTPYEFVARAIAFLADTGATLTKASVSQYALELSRLANVGGIKFDDVYDAIKDVVNDLHAGKLLAQLEKRQR